ncbi:MAG: TatD family hydrolase [Thermomicrobiales bacterium]
MDTHCHLDTDVFSGDVEDVLDGARDAGVRAFVNVGFNPDTWASTIVLAQRHPDVNFALGLHPQDAKLWSRPTVNTLTRLIEEHRPVAIGEIGIDLFRGETNLDQQRLAFCDQLDLALAHRLPVIIHMRSAQSEVLETLVSREVNPRLLFHSFEGTEELTTFVAEHGSMVGIGGLATRSKSVTIRQQLEHIPLTHMVLETDSPYLVPAKTKGSRNTPMAIPKIAHVLSDLKSISLATVAAETTRNAETFFGRLGL